jgi:hypothetical protein
MCFVLGFFQCLAFAYSLVLVHQLANKLKIKRALCNFAFALMRSVLGFFRCLAFAYSLVLVASTC